MRPVRAVGAVLEVKSCALLAESEHESSALLLPIDEGDRRWRNYWGPGGTGLRRRGTQSEQAQGRDSAADQPVVDGEEEVLDDSDIERTADRYATRVLVGDDSVPQVDAVDFKDLAKRASQIERASGADASAVIFAWASRTREYAIATMAVNALYRGSGARRQLRQQLERHVDLDATNETDRALLRCVYGEPERDARVA